MIVLVKFSHPGVGKDRNLRISLSISFEMLSMLCKKLVHVFLPILLFSATNPFQANLLKPIHLADGVERHRIKTEQVNNFQLVLLNLSSSLNVPVLAPGNVEIFYLGGPFKSPIVGSQIEVSQKVRDMGDFGGCEVCHQNNALGKLDAILLTELLHIAEQILFVKLRGVEDLADDCVPILPCELNTQKSTVICELSVEAKNCNVCYRFLWFRRLENGVIQIGRAHV